MAGRYFTTPVMGGRPEVVTLLLEAGADVNGQTGDGVTPLINAIEWGYTEVVAALLTYEPDLNARDKYSRTALKMAKELSHHQIVALLQTTKTAELRINDIQSLTEAD